MNWLLRYGLSLSMSMSFLLKQILVWYHHDLGYLDFCIGCHSAWWSSDGAASSYVDGESRITGRMYSAVFASAQCYYFVGGEQVVGLDAEKRMSFRVITPAGSMTSIPDTCAPFQHGS